VLYILGMSPGIIEKYSMGLISAVTEYIYMLSENISHEF